MKEMEIESVKCDCCSLKEDCTQDYISQVRLNFEGKWLCGLCAEAVRDELSKALDIEESRGGGDVREAMRAHTKFCQRFFQSNPAVCVADGMRQMLRRRSGDFNSVVVGAGAGAGGAGASSKGPSKKHRSPIGSQVGDESSLSF